MKTAGMSPPNGVQAISLISPTVYSRPLVQVLREPYNTSIASSYIQAWHLRDSATGWPEASTLLSAPLRLGLRLPLSKGLWVLWFGHSLLHSPKFHLPSTPSTKYDECNDRWAYRNAGMRVVHARSAGRTQRYARHTGNAGMHGSGGSCFVWELGSLGQYGLPVIDRPYRYRAMCSRWRVYAHNTHLRTHSQVSSIGSGSRIIYFYVLSKKPPLHLQLLLSSRAPAQLMPSSQIDQLM